MLATHATPRKRSTRNPFRAALWDEQHPEYLRLDAQLPPEHHARWLKDAVARLDLGPLRRLYANRGSLAYPPEQLLPFVLYLYSEKLPSPAEWVNHSFSHDLANTRAAAAGRAFNSSTASAFIAGNTSSPGFTRDRSFSSSSSLVADRFKKWSIK